MKYAFFVVVLANVILFFWEFQHGGFQHETDYSRQASDKQILLLSEWLDQQETEKLRVAENAAVIESPENPEQVQVSEGQVPEPQTAVTEIAELDTVDTAAGGQVQQIEKQATEIVIAEPVDETASGIPNEEEQMEVSESSTSDNGIVLASLAQGETKEAASEIESEQAPEIEECYEVGPFSNEQQLKKWLASQEIEGQPETFSREEQVVSTYLVFYPASETMAESKRNVTMLQNKGIEELWLFKKGEMMGAISLGLFKEKPRAVKLFQKMRSKGINVNITERFKSEQRLYAKVRQAIADRTNSVVGIGKCQ